MEMKDLIPTTLAIAGFLFGLWKYFESQRLKRKLIDRESFLIILTITSRFIGELDQILLARPIDSIIEMKKAREAFEKEMNKIKADMNKLYNKIKEEQSELSRLTLLLESDGLSEHEIEECKSQLSSIEKIYLESQISINALENLAIKSLECMDEINFDPFSEPMYKDLKTVFNKFIFDLEKTPEWKLLSDKKISASIMEIIIQAQTLRSEIGKSLYKNEYSTEQDKTKLILNYRGELIRFQNSLQKDIK